MPNHSHVHILARRLRSELGSQAFLTIERTHITDLLRRVSAEPTTRLKSRLAQELTAVLADSGVAVYPPLDQTTTGDTVRLFHAGSVVSQLVDLITKPDPSTDAELGSIILKIKGKWRFNLEAIDLRDAREGMSQKTYSLSGNNSR